MPRGIFWLVCVLISTPSFAHDEDLQFEETTAPLPTSSPSPVHRQWGIPDMQAVVGKLFVASIPSDAFSGQVQFYEPGGHSWPRWLTLSQKGELKGVPTSADVGVAYLMVRAVGPHAHHYSKDIFAIDIIKPGLDTLLPHTMAKGECGTGIDPLMLTVVLSTELRSIAPARRVTMIETIAAYYAVETDGWYLREVTSLRDDPTIVSSGRGFGGAADGQNLAALSMQVGCGRDIREDLKKTAERVASDAQDGTLTEVLQVPIVRWYTHTELPTFFRDRREVGSGDFSDGDEDGDDYGEPTVSAGSVTSAPPHPHRHHHGEEEGMEGTANSLDTSEAELIEPSEVFYQRPATSLLMNYDNIISTPLFNPERPTVIGLESTHTVTSSTTMTIAPTASFSPVSPSRTSGAVDTTLPFEREHTSSIPERPATGTGLFEASESDSTSVDLDGTSAPTLAVDISSSSVSSSLGSSSTHKEEETSAGVSSTQTTTEEMEPEARNFAPAIGQRPQKVQMFAGSSLRLKLPENTFTDVEDGSTSHLSVKLTTIDGTAIPPDNWIMYNASAREVLAVTWEQHVQAWEFLLTATDKDGDSVSDTLPVHVQQHKRVRSVNHEFSVTVALTRGAFSHAVQWEMDLLSAIAAVYGDKDPNTNIVVRRVSFGSDVNTFTWTNDSLAHDICPLKEIEQLYKVISDDGDPTATFSAIVGPKMRIRSVSYKPLRNCEPVTPIRELTTSAPPLAPNMNFPPLFRNQVDQINATAGELLVYRVPEDALYDPEDGGTRKLKMTLLQADRAELNKKHWLQFDSKNQEFFGLPMDKDVRSIEYQLVCEDRGGLSANDGLIVLVRPRIYHRYSVEFNIALDVPYETFQSSALLKRKFVEKIQGLFGDATPQYIVINAISPGATNDVTIIKWYNTSLPTDHCPDAQIYRLRRVVSSDDGRVTQELVDALGKEFQVISVGLEPEGSCQGELTVLHEPQPPPPPGDTSRPISGDEYLLTYVIPISIIIIMLCLAGLVACLLYRKRHTVKLGAGDEAERHSFRNKGIPVIFQDELEEKPEPENKPPVIMKEEKPPLPPPEYGRAGGLSGGADSPALGGGDDAPYHPPPPFPSSRDSNRSARPKPTPTYRKPPPYVPP